ncbi:hypothetical protein Fmac_017532 [Flemingia macrophylla]|uniref:Secreted protein n=1 Tax=Flemingia macrophylla TaxID=520843 RepID=A0ABD1M2D5_9FABA
MSVKLCCSSSQFVTSIKFVLGILLSVLLRHLQHLEVFSHNGVSGHLKVTQKCCQVSLSFPLYRDRIEHPALGTRIEPSGTTRAGVPPEHPSLGTLADPRGTIRMPLPRYPGRAEGWIIERCHPNAPPSS